MRKSQGWWIPRLDDGGKHPVWRRKRGGDLIISRALRHVKSARSVVQAGGHLGYWPYILAEHFSKVFTFEPDKDNYDSLKLNVDNPNVHIHLGALGCELDTAELVHAKDSTGKHHISNGGSQGGGPINIYTIDWLGLDDVDAIFLDVEGFELFTLQGAIDTICDTYPVVVIEENKTSERYNVEQGEAQKFLAKLGYREVDRYKYDRVFAV